MPSSRHFAPENLAPLLGGDNPLPIVADWEILSKNRISGSNRITDKQKPKTRVETLKS